MRRRCHHLLHHRQNSDPPFLSSPFLPFARARKRASTHSHMILIPPLARTHARPPTAPPRAVCASLRAPYAPSFFFHAPSAPCLRAPCPRAPCLRAERGLARPRAGGRARARAAEDAAARGAFRERRRVRCRAARRRALLCAPSSRRVRPSAPCSRVTCRGMRTRRCAGARARHLACHLGLGRTGGERLGYVRARRKCAALPSQPTGL